jgi:hypothetical protein
MINHVNEKRNLEIEKFEKLFMNSRFQCIIGIGAIRFQWIFQAFQLTSACLVVLATIDLRNWRQPTWRITCDDPKLAYEDK